MNAASSSAFYDFQDLASLRSQAAGKPAEATAEVAAQFEALFVQMMVKSMREATIEGGLFESNQMDFYQGMFDQQVSLHLSRQGALGLSDILTRQLDGEIEQSERTAETEVPRPEAFLATTRSALAAVAPITAAPAVAPTYATSSQRATEQADFAPDSPEAYIREVWNHAVQAGQRIGLDPNVLVAQSALETGWGRKVIQAADGRSSFNLFGIKAGGQWAGETASVNTVEYRDGLASIERASFRVYDSVAASFEDYVDFLSANPRYQSALEKAADGREFVRELQGAGYATDPEYADKIISILDTESYRPVFEALKNPVALSLTGEN